MPKDSWNRAPDCLFEWSRCRVLRRSKSNLRNIASEVLPPTVRARLAIEAGATQGWWKWTGPSGGVIGVDRFGACARDLETWREYGFNCENVISHARRIAEAVQAPGCV